MAHSFPSPLPSDNRQNSSPQQLGDMASRRTRRRSVTPTGSAFGSISGFSESASSVRGPIPHMYSTSYGSPLAQLPDRNLIRGGGDIKKAAADIFTTIIQDDGEAQNRRQNQPRRSARNATQSQTSVSSAQEPEPIAPVHPAPAPRAITGKGKARALRTEEAANIPESPPLSPKPRSAFEARSQPSTRTSPSSSQRLVRASKSPTATSPSRITRSRASPKPSTSAARPPPPKPTTRRARPQRFLSSDSEPEPSDTPGSPSSSQSSEPPVEVALPKVGSRQSEIESTSSDVSQTAVSQPSVTRGKSAPIGWTAPTQPRASWPSQERGAQELPTLEEAPDYEQLPDYTEEYEVEEPAAEKAPSLPSNLLQPQNKTLGQLEDNYFRSQPQDPQVFVVNTDGIIRSDLLEQAMALDDPLEDQSSQANPQPAAPGPGPLFQKQIDRPESPPSTEESESPNAGEKGEGLPKANDPPPRGVRRSRTPDPDGDVDQQQRDREAAQQRAANARLGRNNLANKGVPRSPDAEVIPPASPAHSWVEERGIYETSGVLPPVDSGAAPARTVPRANLNLQPGQPLLRPRVTPGIDKNSLDYRRAVAERTDALNRNERALKSSFANELRKRPGQPGDTGDDSSSSGSDVGGARRNIPPLDRHKFPLTPEGSSANSITSSDLNKGTRATAISGKQGVSPSPAGAANKLPFPRIAPLVKGLSWRGIMSIIVLAALSFGFLPFLYHRIQDADWNSGIGPVLRWPDLGNLWGRDNSWGDGLTDRQFADLKRILDSKIKKHDDTLKRLESLLPGAVFVRKDNRGNVVIPSDFWDALKARVKQDGSIFTLDDKSRLSEKQWKSIQDRLRSDKTVNSIVSKEWEDWKKKNEDLVREHAKDSGKGHPSGGTIISRSYILNEIATALDKSKKEVEKEMVDLRKELHGLIRGIQSNLGHSHGKTGTAAPDGSTLSMEEITNLVQNIVAQKITDRQLALAAKTGKVLTRDSELRSHQANAFAAGNGAFVDLSLSSPTWARPKHSDGSSAWARAFKPGYYSQHTQALSPWSEPGHCWCAAVRSSTKDRKKPTSDLSVRMQNFIVPRHIVVEHINPELTIDPGSMPKDLEVWGVYDIPGRRDSVREFSLKQYPKQDEELLRQGLLQIGNFRYQYQAKDEGVYIHDMSKQLEQVDAATDQILIRAISNVGGVDHTCFYRVRLYGHERKGLARTDRRWWDDFEEDVA